MTDCKKPQNLKSAQTRGAAYALLSYGFQYPDRDLCEALFAPERWLSWPRAIREMDPAVGEAIHEVCNCLQAVSVPSDGGTAPSEFQDVYIRLFGHAVRGKCPLYELEYGRSEITQQASGLADIAGFYTAFGMELDRDTDERVDHIAIESEFMSVLCRKEALALEENHEEHQEVTVKAQRTFLRDHLAAWFPAFAYRVQEADPDGFYGALAKFGSALVTLECRRFDLTLGPRTMELRQVDPESDTTINCGSLGDRTQGGGDELVQLNVGSGPKMDV